MLNNTTKNVKYCQIWSNIVENLVKNQAFFREIYSKISKEAFFQPKFWFFFLQNPVSGPLKRHDGGWKCLIIQQKIVKFGHILQVKHKNRLFFSQNFDIFSQNLVSGPHKRHDGGQNFLIFQKIQNLSNFKNS